MAASQGSLFSATEKKSALRVWVNGKEVIDYQPDPLER
jgi:hypothetical protein